jgi:hypothetical protein
MIAALIFISAGLACADIGPADADFTGNGNVGLADFSILSSSWMHALAWYPDGLSAQKITHWALDQNAMDSQFTFDGTVFGNPTWYTKKSNPNEVKVGSGSIGLVGQDYLVVDASRFPHFYGSFTLEAWIKTNFFQHTQTILSKGETSWKIGVEAVTGKTFFACSGLVGANYLAGNTFVSDGLWHHLAGVYDSNQGKMYLYLDGVIDAQADASGQINRNDLDIWIGGNPQTPNDWWQGTLDNICIYNCARTLEQIYLRNTYHVDVVNGMDIPGQPDPEWGKGKLKAFKTIQHAIDVANDGDMILVWPGIYQESLFFMGKAITVRSAADAAILKPDPADGIAVTFLYGEQYDSVFEHFVIINSDVALWIHQSSPTLRHLTVVNNGWGIDSIFNSLPVIEHCVFWDNSQSDMIYDTYAPIATYCCMQQPYAGQGNISSDPLFVNPDTSDPNMMDFHLQSEYGRYVSDGNALQRPLPQNWTCDNQTSPCIDAGWPEMNPFCETMYNGGRINMGAYGNTPFAAQSPWALAADMDHNGIVHVDDILLFSEQWLTPGSQ